MLKIIWAFQWIVIFCSNGIKDHWSQRSHNKYDNEKSIKHYGITKRWHRDMKWTNAAGKMALDDKGLPRTFNLSKTQYLHSTIKWTAVRWGVPV